MTSPLPVTQQGTGLYNPHPTTAEAAQRLTLTPRGRGRAGAPRRWVAGASTRRGRGAAEPTCAVPRGQGRPRAAAAALSRPGLLSTAPGWTSSEPAPAPPEPCGPAPAPEVVAGDAEHVGTLVGPRTNSQGYGIRSSRTRTFRSALSVYMTSAAANEQEKFACSAPPLIKGTNRVAR